MGKQPKKTPGFGIWDLVPLLHLELIPELFQPRFQLGNAAPGSLLPLGSGQPVLQLLVLGIPKKTPIIPFFFPIFFPHFF